MVAIEARNITALKQKLNRPMPMFQRLVQDNTDEIQAAAGPQRPQHEPGTRTAKDARRNRRVEVILNRDLKRDKFTDDRGRKASVQAVEEKLAPDLEPRHEEQRYIDQQVPDRGRKQPGRIPAEQTGTENPPGKEAVMAQPQPARREKRKQRRQSAGTGSTTWTERACFFEAN